MPVEFGRAGPILNLTGKPTGQYARPTLKPGEVAKVKVNDEIYDVYNKRFKEFEADDIKMVGVDLYYVKYEDNTIWVQGTTMWPNPDDPSRYSPSDPSKRRPTLFFVNSYYLPPLE